MTYNTYPGIVWLVTARGPFFATIVFVCCFVND